MSSTISACIIAKDEERHIDRCLRSLEGIVDEIIVVDTGSKDRTVEIAKSYGAKVFFRKWENDFSKARNEALSYATGDYIIYIDCDEYLEGSIWKGLKSRLNKKYEGYCTFFVNMINGEKTLVSQTFRIFKNNPNYRFEGPIHEQIIKSIFKTHTREDIGFIEGEIYHLGYDKNEYDLEKKRERNFKIYKTYPKEQKDGFFYYNLAGEYSRAGMEQEALKYYLKSYETEAFDNGFRKHLAIYLTKIFFEFKKFKSAIEYSSKFLKEFEEFSDLYFLRGICFYSIGKFNESLKDFEVYEKYRGNVNYPDFKLGNSNKIAKILKEVQNKGVVFQKDLLGIVVDYRETKNSDSILKLNEYTNNLTVLVDREVQEESVNQLEELYCNVFKSEEAALASIKNTKYIFYFKENEFLERDWFIKTIEEINKGYDIIESMALDRDFNVYISPRAIKTDVLLKEGLDLIKAKSFKGYNVSPDKIMVINI